MKRLRAVDAIATIASKAWQWAAPILVAVALGGCAAPLPPHGTREPTQTLVAAAGAPLTDVAGRAGIAPEATGAWPLPQAAFALDARVAAIAAATRSIDIQTYLLGDDGVGRLVLGALANAAARGVRVRLLVDDIYTAGLDPLLLGLALQPNAEVRLFNPFVRGRASSFGRLVAFANDFHRLDHRMHNKLFVADGQVALVGGRNLADEYFLRGRTGNFFDLDILLVGAVVPSLSAHFDRYWNSERAYDVRQIVANAGAPVPSDEDLKDAFAQRTSAEATPEAPARDEFGAEPFGVQLATGRFHFIAVDRVAVHADPPDKVRPAATLHEDTVSTRFLGRLAEAQEEVVILSPYFIPDHRIVERMHELRARGVAVRIVTNSLAVSDEPFTSLALERHQRELLAMGVELYELSSTRAKLDLDLKSLLGSSIGRLHAKLAIIDRHLVLVGSLNLDGRSAHINTEIGVRFDSPSIASMLFTAFRLGEAAAVYRVKLQPDGRTLVWTVRDDGGNEVSLDQEPDASWWQHLRVRLLSLFVPEDEL